MVPVSTSLKVPCGNDKIPVAMAPLAQSKADNIAAYIMREKCSTWCGQGNNSSIGAMGGTTWPKQE